MEYIHRLPHTVRLSARFHICAHLCVHTWGHTLTPLLLRKSWLHCHSNVLTSVLKSPSHPPSPGSLAPASSPLPSGAGPRSVLPLSVPVTPTAQASLLGPLGAWLWLRPVFPTEFTLSEQVAAVTSRGIGNWSDSKSITTTREKGAWFQAAGPVQRAACRGSSVPGGWGGIQRSHGLSSDMGGAPG